MKKGGSPKKKSFRDIFFEFLYLTKGRKGISRYFRRDFNISFDSSGDTVVSGKMMVYEYVIYSHAREEKELRENFDLLIELVLGDRVNDQEGITTEILDQEFNHN